MVKHVILWKLKEELSETEKAAVKADIKTHLEALNGKIDGLIDIKIVIDALPSSTVDLMLDSTLSNEQALRNYAVHPLHVEAANTYVRPYTAVRSCLDFEI